MKTRQELIKQLQIQADNLTSVVDYLIDLQREDALPYMYLIKEIRKSIEIYISTIE